MKLISFVSAIAGDEVVHITQGDNTRYFGTINNAYSELDDAYLHEAEVIYVHSGFGGLCIEAEI